MIFSLQYLYGHVGQDTNKRNQQLYLIPDIIISHIKILLIPILDFWEKDWGIVCFILKIHKDLHLRILYATK